MRQIIKDLNKLREDDLVTIILFCLYRMTGDPEYSTIAELAYTLDRNSMYNLCATFGGTTLKIPTLQEYKDLVNVMLVFDYVNSDGLSFEEACSKTGVDPLDDKVINTYQTMSEILSEYEY